MYLKWCKPQKTLKISKSNFYFRWWFGCDEVRLLQCVRLSWEEINNKISAFSLDAEICTDTLSITEINYFSPKETCKSSMVERHLSSSSTKKLNDFIPGQTEHITILETFLALDLRIIRIYDKRYLSLHVLCINYHL